MTPAISKPSVAKPKVSIINITAGIRSKTFVVTTANVSSTRSATITGFADSGSKGSVLMAK